MNWEEIWEISISVTHCSNNNFLIQLTMLESNCVLRKILLVLNFVQRLQSIRQAI